MTERPDLSTKLDAATFRSYYYLKVELVCFRRQGGNYRKNRLLP